MSRMQSAVKNLGTAKATPLDGSIDAITKFANSVRPMRILTSLTPDGTEITGENGINLVPAHVNYGKLYLYNGASWVTQTPADESVALAHLASDVVVAGKIISAVIDGVLITGNTIRTAATGARIQLDPTDGIRVYDGSGLRTQIAIGGAITYSGYIVGLASLSGTLGLQGGNSTTDIELSTSTSREGYVICSYTSAVNIGTDNTQRVSISEGGVYVSNITDGLYIPDDTGFFVGSVQVMGPRITGWAAATGTADRATFVTSTVTLEELAERVKALIDDFMTHGAIGT